MDNSYQAVLQWLIDQQSITSNSGYELAAKAIEAASKKYPSYYREFPNGDGEAIEKEIFEAYVLELYVTNYLTGNGLALYQQDTVRKLMKLRRLDLKMK